MEIEGGGGLAATLAHERGKKRPLSPPTIPGDDDDSSKSTSEYDDGDWLVSGSEEDEDHENKGRYPPFTVDDIPRPTCDFYQQSHILFKNPDAERRGPKPIRLFPAFRSGKHYFGSDYNLHDKSEISATNVGDCSGECLCVSMNLLQFIDVKLAGYQHGRSGSGCAKIFGFVAARETDQPLRNYVYKREIGNCETVSVKQETGVARLSLTSPTRVISILSRALVEFELHSLNEDEKDGDDDLIIEGCTELDHLYEPKSFVETRRLYSDMCALDIKYGVLLNAVEARVNIEVLRVPFHGVDLKLYAKTSGFSDIIGLFQGAALEMGFTRSFAVAVVRYRSLDLYINGSPRDDHALGQKPMQGSWRHSFSSDIHGTVEALVELGDYAEISVKITWKSYSKKP